MNRTASRILSLTAVGAAILSMSGIAAADTAWQRSHPRREQVNHRLSNQNRRIRQDVKNGTLTRGQATALHRDDHQIRQEERDMASQNGSHITKSEQHVLNQQENSLSRQIPPK
jgi:hypothetical protein